MIYTLISNDGHSIHFCDHQLELLEFAKSALTDLGTGSWVDPENNELPVPGLNMEMLKRVAEWTTIATRIPYDERRFKRKELVQTQSLIMKNGRESTGYKFAYSPPVIDETIKWTKEDTGVATELLEWADRMRETLTVSEIFELLDAATFIGAHDMIELLACRVAWEMIQGREKVYAEAEKTKTCKVEFMSTAKKLEFFKCWLDTDDTENTNQIKSFFREVRDNFKRWPHLRAIILDYQNHGGLPVPRETWGETEWEQFKEGALSYYSSWPTE